MIIIPAKAGIQGRTFVKAVALFAQLEPGLDRGGEPSSCEVQAVQVSLNARLKFRPSTLSVTRAE